METIIKVNHLDKNSIQKIYLFTGYIKIQPEYPWNSKDSNSVFSEKELYAIKSQNIPVEIINSYLHGDDPIITIKNKIIKYSNMQISNKELYLFGIQKQTLEPYSIYKNLSQNETTPITRNKICEFLLNVIDTECNTTDIEKKCDIELPDKDSYDLNDIENLPIPWNKSSTISIPIGQSLNGKTPHIFACNPYNCLIMNDNIKQNSKKILSTNNSNLLFEYFPLCNNTLFMCTAEEVIDFSNSIDNISEENFINIFFPNLSIKYNIKNKDDLIKNKDNLYKEQTDFIDDTFQNYNDKIDLFHNIKNDTTEQFSYIDKNTGISKIDFIIHPKYKINIPLETIFKLIKTSFDIPLIKYNPGKGIENVYRLFTNNNTTITGKQIPYLYTTNNNRKGKIINISKILAKKKRVAFYIEYTLDKVNFSIDCEIENNGNIHISVTQNTTTTIDVIENVIINAINKPIIETIKNFIQESGYSFEDFKSIQDKNIEIINIVKNYEIKYNLPLNLKKINGCIPNIFTLVSDEKDNIHFKFKRVSNYNEMNAVESLITKLRKSDESSDTIIKKLVENFPNLTDVTAAEQYYKWVSQVNVAENLFSNKRISIITNTGFNIIISRNKFSGIVTVKASEINDLSYIHYINIYIDSLFKLLTNPKLPDKIKELCKIKSDDIQIEETIQPQKIKFQKSKKDTDKFLSMFDNNDSESSSSNESSQNDIEFDLDDFDFKDIDIEASEEKTPPLSDKQLDQYSSPKSTKELESETDVDFINLDNMGLEEEEEKTKDISVKSVETNNDDSINIDELNMDAFNLDNINDESQDNQEDLKQPTPQDKVVTSESKDIEGASETKGTPSETNDDPPEEIIDLKNVNLKGSNSIFSQKRDQLEPEIFLKTDVGKYNGYSKMCPANSSKQPIILKDDEKKYIDKKDTEYGTKSYDEHITYGSDPDKKYHYICPRFWCLQDENNKQRPISFKEINEGGCGGWDALIPQTTADGKKTKMVPPGKKIYEFTDDKYHKDFATKNLLVYKPHYPSFMSKDKHPKNLCVPCCFGKPTTMGDSDWEIKVDDSNKTYYYNKVTGKKTKTRPKILYDYNYESTGPGSVDGRGPYYEKDKNNNVILDSIKGTKLTRENPPQSRRIATENCNQSDEPKSKSIIKKNTKTDDAPLLDAWPLNQGQIGYIPLVLQRFLGYDCNKLCQESYINNNLKINTPCLLHKGVESSNTQSFLSCIADLFTVASELKKDSTIGELSSKSDITVDTLKKYIIKILTIDGFVILQNGNLINTFYNPQDEPDITPFTDSKLFKKISKVTQSPSYFKKIVSAFINFKKYITDNNEFIDYTYLWDLICLPKKKSPSSLFKKGLNLIILNSPNNDITSKIEVICPKNYYSKNIFDSNINFAIIYCKNGYFEPIYSFTKIQKKTYRTTKLFDLNTITREFPNVGKIIKNIWKDISSKCSPLPSMPNIYRFSDNIYAKNIISALNTSNSIYQFSNQILNFDHKVIGILASKPNDPSDYIYIPAKPSTIDINLPFDYVSSPAIINSYKDTIDKLKYIKNITKNLVLCQPSYKSVVDNFIVGIFTETNQFIPTSPQPYEKSNDDDIKPIITNNLSKNTNYIDSDLAISTTNSPDKKRTLVIKKIQLENHFYTIFRNTTKTLLNNSENIQYKKNIKNIIYDFTITYYDKLSSVTQILKELLDNYIIFTEYNIDSLEKIKKLEICLNLSPDSCNKNSSCSLTTIDDNNICKLIIPSNNLISNGDNSNEYFIKIANELISYDKLRDFMFQQENFLSLQQINFNLNENEILLFEYSLMNDYFDDIVPSVKNTHVFNINSWSNTNPRNSFKYSNTFELSESSKGTNLCFDDNKLNFGSIWKDPFKSFDIQRYKTNYLCSWQIFYDILKIHLSNNSISINNICKTLVDIYTPLFNNPQLESTMKTLFDIQGKRNYYNVIQKSIKTINNTITVKEYYLTELDLLLLSNHYDIPLIILCSTNIPSLSSKHVSFIKNLKSANIFYIIYAANYSNRRNRIITPPTYGIVNKKNSIPISIDELSDNLYNQITSINITNIEKYYSLVNRSKKIKGVTSVISKPNAAIDESKIQEFSLKPSVKPPAKRKPKLSAIKSRVIKSSLPSPAKPPAKPPVKSKIKSRVNKTPLSKKKSNSPPKNKSPKIKGKLPNSMLKKMLKKSTPNDTVLDD